MGVPFRPTPRRYDALAFIIECLVRGGGSPSFEEIAGRLGVAKTRARELIDELIREQLIEKTPGAQRSFRVRDVSLCRTILIEALRRQGLIAAVPMGELVGPRPNEHLPMLPPFQHVAEED